jgi:hypothetical protein
MNDVRRAPIPHNVLRGISCNLLLSEIHRLYAVSAAFMRAALDAD